MRVARVVLDIPARALEAAFDYDIPSHLDAQAAVGRAVLVEFGKRRAVGHVVEIVNDSDVPRRKPVIAFLSPPRFDSVAARLAFRIAEEYVAPLADAVRLFLPPGSVPDAYVKDGEWQLKQAAVRPVIERVVERAAGSKFEPSPNARRQRALLDALSEGPLTTGELTALLGPVSDAIRRLADAGAVTITERRRRRDPLASTRPAPRHETLSAGQLQALTAIAEASPGSWVLLRGVTGSGKTEVYLRAIEEARQAGRGAIVLVPEIALTPQTVGRFRTRFGDDVAVLHSRLTPGERLDEFDRMVAGEAHIVVGARSAIFAPVRDLGIIIIDEEHETSYKQGSSPRYVTRDVARWLAYERGAVLVSGSATPSMESLYAHTRGLCALVDLPERVGAGRIPAVEVVDLTVEFAAGNRSMFSRRLADALSGVADRGEKAMLLMNRRGYASFLLCRECGFVPGCDRCSTSYTYHDTGPMLACHHCGTHVRIPADCPRCSSPYLRRFGAGTQRVAEEAARLLPNTPIIRMDADTTSARGGHERRLAEFESHSSAVLVGTQMVAKGLDYPDVTLVGVVSADTTLHLPDVRAGERTFQLLEQVAGRAGRGAAGGTVIIQTYWPQHPAIRAVACRDPSIFYASDSHDRKALGFPPYGRLANIVVTSTDSDVARTHAGVIAEALRRRDHRLEVIGPAPAPLARIKDRHRWHVLVKAGIDDALGRVVRDALDSSHAPAGVSVAPDIDPLDLS
ncbi:MAG: primosomal protein N' [Clostridiales bacterium]|nr:primosomal protein N' [Clostridiales bacterium]